MLVPCYFLKAAIAMKRTTEKTGLLTAAFALIFLSHSAFSETVYKCKANAEHGHTFSVVMPEESTEYLATVNSAGDARVVNFGQKIGVGSITFDNMGGQRWSTKFIVTRHPRPGFSPIGFFLFADNLQTLRIDTTGAGTFPFELYDPMAIYSSQKTLGVCQ